MHDRRLTLDPSPRTSRHGTPADAINPTRAAVGSGALLQGARQRGHRLMWGPRGTLLVRLGAPSEHSGGASFLPRCRHGPATPLLRTTRDPRGGRISGRRSGQRSDVVSPPTGRTARDRRARNPPSHYGRPPSIVEARRAVALGGSLGTCCARGASPRLAARHGSDAAASRHARLPRPAFDQPASPGAACQPCRSGELVGRRIFDPRFANVSHLAGGLERQSGSW